MLIGVLDVADRRSEVVDALAALGGGAHVGCVRELAFDGLDTRVGETPAAFPGPNERSHGMSRLGERLGQMAARESRRPGDQHFHYDLLGLGRHAGRDA